MGHPFRVREIAAQSGLSEATVDRVLNQRAGVRAGTRDQVQEAVDDLQRQRSQLRLGARTFFVDVLVQAPQRFSSAVRSALEAELPGLRPAVVRTRFHLREEESVEELVTVLDRIVDRGSHGVILKAPDTPAVVAAVGRLVDAGIPVVTLVTDLPTSRRLDYVGIDNRAAGATAAYLVGQWLGDHDGDVLLTLSSSFFRGEEEREMGFRAAMRAAHPHRSLVEMTGSGGLDRLQRDLVAGALEQHPQICAVYSIGGANNAVLDAFEAAGRSCRVFIAHDLDRDNVELLHRGRLSAVLHHDLGTDVRVACQVIMAAGNAIPAPHRATAPSTIQVVTPYNVPS